MAKSSTNGVRIFRAHKILWTILGNLPPSQHKTRYHIFSIVLNIGITFCYPLHLMIGLFRSETPNDIFQNLAINVTCCCTSVKALFIWWNMYNMRKIDDIITKLNKRIEEQAHVKYYSNQVQGSAMAVFYLFCAVYIGCAVTSESSTLISGIVADWRLMYPAYFPFDAYGSGFNYFVAHSYQFVGESIHILQNLVNDSYVAMLLAMLAGQARLLAERLSSIGYDKDKSMEENNAELLACIEDYQILLDFRRIIEQIVSVPMFAQLLCSSFNIGITILYLIFFVSDALSASYYFVYCIAMALQIFPCCYYGTVFGMEFDKLTYSMFSSNWMDQNKIFKQDLRILAEQTLRRRRVMAGGIFYIDLGTFFATCRGAYSLFSLAVQMK